MEWFKTNINKLTVIYRECSIVNTFEGLEDNRHFIVVADSEEKMFILGGNSLKNLRKKIDGNYVTPLSSFYSDYNSALRKIHALSLKYDSAHLYSDDINIQATGDSKKYMIHEDFLGEYVKWLVPKDGEYSGMHSLNDTYVIREEDFSS